VVHKLGREAESSNFEINLVHIQNCRFSKGDNRWIAELGLYQKGIYTLSKFREYISLLPSP
jgi:hypothetical protein